VGLAVVVLARVGQLLQIGARGEGAAGAGEDHHRDAVVRRCCPQRVAGGIVEGVVEGVEGCGPVEGDGAHSSRVLQQDEFGVSHGLAGLAVIVGWLRWPV
jgi:hypothetical protein